MRPVISLVVALSLAAALTLASCTAEPGGEQSIFYNVDADKFDTLDDRDIRILADLLGRIKEAI